MFSNLSIRSRLFLNICAMSFLAVMISVMGLAGIKYSNSSLHSVYVDRVIPLRDLKVIADMYAVNIVDTSHKLRNGNISWQEAIKNIDEAEKTIDVKWNGYLGTTLIESESQIISEIKPLFVSIAPKLEKLRTIIKQQDNAALSDFTIHELYPAIDPISAKFSELIDVQLDESKHQYDEAQNAYNTILICSILLLAAGLGGCLLVDLSLIKRFTTSMKNAQDIANQIANGNLKSEIFIESNDEISVLLRAMQSMRETIISFIDAQQLMAKKHSEGWISERLDASRFKGSYNEMAKNVNEMVADHIAVKMRVIAILEQYGKGNFSIDMEQLPAEKAKVSDAMTTLKNNLLSINNEITSLVKASEQGDFSKRANANNYDFVFKSMLMNLNSLVATCDDAFSEVLRISKALADSDLTQTITKDYPGLFGQVKVSMNNTTASLQTLMSEIRETSDVIAAAAKEIATGNNDLSHRTEEQAASLEETAASMHELTSTVEHNSDNAKQANELAVGATDIANKGVLVVEQVVSTMENINQSSLRIVDIISVIDDIAFQTNILALNAAVEAARAGEQGKGFAVVATEVRNLAQRAANAAGEIKRLIGDSVERVSSGSKQVTEAGRTMQDIVEAIEGVTRIMSEIASASNEQSSGIAQVGQAVSSMDEMTQQNAALVEQVAATAESLESQTSHLAREMAKFKTSASQAGFKSMQSAPMAKSYASSSKPVASAPAKIPTPAVVEVSSSNSLFDSDSEWEEF